MVDWVMTGDVTNASASEVTVIANDAVTNAKLANMATATFKGRATAGTGDPEDMSAATAWSVLGVAPSANAPAFTGDVTNPAGSLAMTIADKWSYALLTADYTLVNQAAAQKLFNSTANGALTLTTGFHFFEAVIYIDTMSTTSGNGGFDLLGAGGATLANIMYHASGVDLSNPATVGALSGCISRVSASAASIVTAGVAAGMMVKISGIFNCTVAGTLIPSMSQVTAAAAVVKAGTFFRALRVGATGSNTGGAWS